MGNANRGVLKILKEMRESADHSPNFRTLFESAPGLFLVLSPELKIVAASNAYLSATMTKREEIFGKGIFDVFPDNPNDSSATGVGNLKASLHRVLETKVPDAMAVQKYDIPKSESAGGGFEERYWSPLNTPVLGTDNTVDYIIHRVEDVTEFIHLRQRGTEQHKLTEELKTRTQQMESEIFSRALQLQKANQKLRDAERVKNDFFSNVSHEFRTPLSLIHGPIESILSGKFGNVPTAQEQHLKIIHNNSVRLLQMVNGLLDFSKFEAGKMKVEREPINIYTLVQSILNDFESMLNGKHIAIRCEMQVQDRAMMMDRYLFERILFNLLSNAAKFTPERGKVVVRADHHDNTLYLSVEDNGIGISEVDAQELFQKFRQVEGSSTRRFEGTGLGLAMVKEFAELLGGKVSLKSRLGEGSIFTVEVLAPITEVEQAIVSSPSRKVALVPQYFIESPKESIQENKHADKFLKVLICEDNEELRTYVHSLLRGLCVVQTAKDGVEALQLVQSWVPDLVITDVMMPKKDGIAVCKVIKSNPLTSKIMVVLLTALTHREAMLKGWEARADEYLFKPFHPQELITRVTSLLSVISERKKSADLLTLQNKKLEQSNFDLKAFSYSISHDLRAPLRSIIGYSAILAEDHGNVLDREGRKVLDVIISSTHKMERLIDDLLAFSQVEAKEPTVVPVDMNTLVTDLIEEFVAGKKNVEVHLNSLASLKVDESMIRQVWINLISNALKYSSSKEKQQIEIGCYSSDAMITHYIKDNGVGFDMHYYDKLFGVFQRLHSATDFEGTGIGLAIVHRVIAKHGGRVWAEAKVNEGATFSFSLPVN